MKRPIVRIVLSAGLLLAAMGLTTLAMLQLPETTPTTSIAGSYSAQNLEAPRVALERAINEARVKPAKKHSEAVDAAFRNYQAVVHVQESEILNRLYEVETLMGKVGSTSSFDTGTALKGPKADPYANQFRAEYEELSARLEALRTEFGSANVEVNKILGPQARGESLKAAATCNVLIINGASTTSEPDTTADATTTLSNIVSQNGGTVTVSDPVPASLAGFDVIYDIRFNPALTAANVSAYLGFLQSGGKLLLVGENGSFQTRNDSVISFVATAGGGGPLTFCDPGCFCAAACTDPTLCSTPNTATTFSLPVPGGTTSSGNGTALLTVGGFCRPVSVFRPGQLTNATAGTLITFFDINTFQTEFSDGNDNLKLVCNIAGFFCGFSGGTCNPGGNCMLICPPEFNVAAGSGCPLGTGAVANFPLPSTSGNCGPVTCSPPPGSFFPVGNTTVTCTTPSGNACAFNVRVFSACLQDDSDPSITVMFNAQTGEYFFCCGPLAFSSVGTLTVRGCVVTIQHNAPNFNVLIKFDGAVNVGSASTQFRTTNVNCTITDRNTTNNNCVCP